MIIPCNLTCKGVAYVIDPSAAPVSISFVSLDAASNAAIYTDESNTDADIPSARYIM